MDAHTLMTKIKVRVPVLYPLQSAKYYCTSLVVVAYTAGFYPVPFDGKRNMVWWVSCYKWSNQVFLEVKCGQWSIGVTVEVGVTVGIRINDSV